MSHLKEKYNESVKLAISLQKSYDYSASINRAYYACLQFMLHTLFNKKNDPYNKEHFYSGALVAEKSTHKQAFNLITTDLAKIHKPDFRWFQQHFQELKKLRTSADYHDEKATSENADIAIKKSEALVNILKNNFKTS
ncbi:MAG: HEPN domain-containing protein [Flavobacterium sp.]|nr:HEPN domain-containing protein [Flavobacterium sp.]